MLTDGLRLIEGSAIINAAVATGTTFPNDADPGELFFRTDLGALHVYNGSIWVEVGLTSALLNGQPGSYYLDLPNHTGVLALSQGGTGSGTPSVARSNLGLAIGSDVQAFSTSLTNVAALSGTTGIARKTGADTWVLDTNTYLTGNQTITISGDLSASGTTSLTATLATVNSNVGSFGSSTQIPVLTVNAKGLVTAVSTASITTSFNITGDVSGTIASGTGTLTLGTVNSNVGQFTALTVNAKGLVTAASNLTVSGDVSGTASGSTLTLTLPTTGVTAAAYGSATQVGTFTVDAKGRLTAAASTAIAIPTSAVTSGTFADARIAVSNVTQHQAALTITESQITDGSILARNAGNETITGNWTFSNAVTGVDPTTASHLATKQYVDTTATGLSFKSSVRAATTGNITLSGTQTIDGVSLVAGNRVLVKDQSTGSQNGIYVVAAGAWTRSSDFDGSPASEVSAGAYMFVREGTLYANSGWVLSTPDPITLGTTALTFTQFTGLAQIDAGAGMSKTGSTLNIGTASASRIVINTDDIDLATVGTAGTYRSVTTDAYGRVTAGTNPTTLAGYGITDAQPLNAHLTSISSLATNGLIVRSASGTVTPRSIAVSGTGLSVSNADGASGNPTVTSNATSANTASTIVARDASGNFIAGTISANLNGNASRVSITGTGDANVSGLNSGATQYTNTTGSTNFPSSFGNTLEVRRAPAGTSSTGTYQLWSSTSGVTEDLYFRKVNGFTTVDTWSAWRLMVHEGNIGTLVPSPTGTGASGTWNISISGNAATASSATALATGRTFSVTGDATGTSGAFDGTANASIPLTLANSGVTAASYGTATQVPSFTVDAKGRVTAASNTTIAIPTSAVTSGTFADARIAQSNVTQHQAALSIGEGQITGTTIFARKASNETITGNWTFSNAVAGVDPTAASHLATKQYVDNSTTGLSFKQSVRVATTGNITLSGAQTIDGVAVVSGNRVLVKDQTTGSQNGIYVVAPAAWTRATDFDGTPAAEVAAGAYMFVREGTLNGNSGWVLSTPDPITLGTTALTFTQFTGLAQIDAGAGLIKTGSTLDVVGTAGRIVALADSIDLATTGVAASTYRSVTVDTYGRVTAGTNPTTLAGYGITDGVLKTGDTMTGALNLSYTNPNLIVSATASGQGASILLRTGSSNRWLITKSATAEGGSNTGSDLGFVRYDDSGNSLGTAFIIDRASGRVAVGSGVSGGTTFAAAKAQTGATITQGILSRGEVQSDSTVQASLFHTWLYTQATTWTLPILSHYAAQQVTIGAGNTITNQYGFNATNTLTGATNNYGFYSAIPVGTGRWGVFVAADAQSYFSGNVGIGSGKTVPTAALDVNGTVLATTVSAPTHSISSVGDIVSASLTTSTTSANQVVATLAAATYRSAKFQIQVTSGTAYQATEVMVVHDGTLAYMTEFGTVNTGANLATFDSDISGGNIRLLVTPVNAVTTIKVVRTAVTV